MPHVAAMATGSKRAHIPGQLLRVGARRPHPQVSVEAGAALCGREKGNGKKERYSLPVPTSSRHWADGSQRAWCTGKHAVWLADSGMLTARVRRGRVV
eukprot:scaffold170527_cov32-Tisochrysis_lutea.AAC.2